MKKINKIWYPTLKQIISYNKRILSKKEWRATKAEKHEVLNRNTILEAIKETKQFPGNIDDKAAILVRTLQYHPFGAANRRTAYFTMNKFLWKNKGYMVLKDKENGKEFMTKLRRGELSHTQIKEEISSRNIENAI